MQHWKAILDVVLHVGEYSEFWIALVLGTFSHELGHIFVALILRVRVKGVGMSWLGPYIIRADGGPFENILIALAGPTVNVLLCAISIFGLPIFGVVNLMLALVNLLPTVRSSDGHRIVVNLKRAMLWGETQ